MWSNNYACHVPKFKETFPELNKLSNEEMCDRWIKLGIDFYAEEVKPVKVWVRFTLPIAVVVLLLMFLSLPVVFMITGKWGYAFGKKNRLMNWFKMLRLLNL